MCIQQAPKKAIKPITPMKKTGIGQRHRGHPSKSCKVTPITQRARLAERCISIPEGRRIRMIPDRMITSGLSNGPVRIGRSLKRFQRRLTRITEKPIHRQQLMARSIFSHGGDRARVEMIYGSAGVSMDNTRRQNVFLGPSIRILSNTIPILRPMKAF